MADSSLDLVQGTLDMLVLKALLFGPLHGYGVVQWIRQTTDDAVQVEEGALYVSLHRMEKRVWLRSEWGLSENNRRAKYYTLTAEGREQLTVGAKNWSKYVEAVSKVLQVPEGSR
jgi:transcriptional regulator